MRKIALVLTLYLIFISACAPAVPEAAPTPTRANTRAPANTPTQEPSATAIPSATLTMTPAPMASPSASPTNTPVPTYTIPRGVVNQEHVNCYYGPSKAYLYKYGLLKGNRLDIIGYMADTGYIEVQAIGGDNPCWMNLEFMDVQGEINTVKPVDPKDVKLPWSPYYSALTYAKAERDGDEVTISWSPLVLKAGDDSEQESYLLEAWVCRSGRLTFVPVGVYQNQAKVVDEYGCSEPSFGRVYGVEKHGYTKYLMFDWPQN